MVSSTESVSLKTIVNQYRSPAPNQNRHKCRCRTSAFVFPAVPTFRISSDSKPELPGFPFRSPLLSSYFSPSRLICQRVSPHHHSVWQADYLWGVTHSTSSPQPSSPLGRDTPCNKAFRAANEERPHVSWNEGSMRGIFQQSSHVAIGTCGRKVNFNCWSQIRKVSFCFNQL